MINHATFPTRVPDALYYDIYRTYSYTDWTQGWEGFCEDHVAFWGPDFAYHFPRGFEEWVANGWREQWENYQVPGGGGGARYGKRHDCSISSRHVTHRWVSEMDMADIDGRGPLTAILQDNETCDAYLLITQQLAEQLREVELRNGSKITW